MSYLSAFIEKQTIQEKIHHFGVILFEISTTYIYIDMVVYYITPCYSLIGIRSSAYIRSIAIIVRVLTLQ
jgi:hypothetical protein